MGLPSIYGIFDGNDDENPVELGVPLFGYVLWRFIAGKIIEQSG